jgi:hypothetical protein
MCIVPVFWGDKIAIKGKISCLLSSRHKNLKDAWRPSFNKRYDESGRKIPNGCHLTT